LRSCLTCRHFTYGPDLDSEGRFRGRCALTGLKGRWVERECELIGKFCRGYRPKEVT